MVDVDQDGEQSAVELRSDPYHAPARIGNRAILHTSVMALD
jgi:hypothetical protein